MTELSDLEREALDAALRGDGPVLDALRKQAEVSGVREREWTGAGFFTRLETQHASPKVRGTVRIGGVFAEVQGLKHGAGFVLTVEDGLLTMLEGFSYEEDWPDRIESFEVHPPTEQPNLSALEVSE